MCEDFGAAECFRVPKLSKVAQLETTIRKNIIISMDLKGSA